jgi:Restriction endonuclease XhoI
MNEVKETDLFHDAIKHWWNSKRSTAVSKKQGGTRDHNLHGKTMDGFAQVIRDFLIEMNVKEEHIFSGGHLSTFPSVLPSFFRPSKNWDLIVLADSRFHSADEGKREPVLYAAIEFKSQDKSIGNNQNNRMEESLGNATDFWATYCNDGFLRQIPRPWLGYFFVGKYEPSSDGKKVKIKQPHFEAMPHFRTEGSSKHEVFEGPSYAERYRIFLKQCVGSRLYDTAAFIVTDESITNANPNHRIPFGEFGPVNFLRCLKAQILAHYPGAEVKTDTLAADISRIV